MTTTKKAERQRNGKEVLVKFKLTPNQHRVLKQVAAAKEQDMSVFVRDAVLDALKPELSPLRTRFEKTLKEFERALG